VGDPREIEETGEREVWRQASMRALSNEWVRTVWRRDKAGIQSKDMKVRGALGVLPTAADTPSLVDSPVGMVFPPRKLSTLAESENEKSKGRGRETKLKFSIHASPLACLSLPQPLPSSSDLYMRQDHPTQ
jgi:hypothetical protein